MRVELEDNLNNNLIRFFKELNKYTEEFDIQSLFEYILSRMRKYDFKCHQQFSFSLKNTMITFQKIEYINNYTIQQSINIIVDEETLKVVGVTKNETKSYNEIIF